MNMHINQTMLDRALLNAVTTFPQFYECAEYQMISLFEQLFGVDATTAPLQTIEAEKDFLNQIKIMLVELSAKLNFKVNDFQIEALCRHLMMHSVVVKEDDNLVLRDYFNPVLMNHFNFFLYLSEYLHTHKDLIVAADKAELKAYITNIATITNLLLFHPLNQASVQHIVDKLIKDNVEEFKFGIKPKREKLAQKFSAQDCKKDFAMKYCCKPSDYQRLMMKQATKGFKWIQEQLFIDRIAIKDMHELTMRYYMYRFLEKEYFEMDYHLRASVPAFVRHAVHSAISDLFICKSTYMQTHLPAEPFGAIKAPEIYAWIDTRMDCETWLGTYQSRNTPVFKDLVAIKVLEMNYMRDQQWDSKLVNKRIKEAVAHTTSTVKHREKFREMHLKAATLCLTK